LTEKLKLIKEEKVLKS